MEAVRSARLSCLTSPWRPPERRQADRRQGSDEWVTSPRWRLPVCSGLFGQSGGKIQNRAMRSECAHKAEHTLQKHVKESVKLLLTLGVLQHGGAGKRESVLRGKVQFVSIKRALSLKSRHMWCGDDCAADIYSNLNKLMIW